MTPFDESIQYYRSQDGWVCTLAPIGVSTMCVRLESSAFFEVRKEEFTVPNPIHEEEKLLDKIRIQLQKNSD